MRVHQSVIFTHVAMERQKGRKDIRHGHWQLWDGGHKHCEQTSYGKGFVFLDNNDALCPVLNQKKKKKLEEIWHAVCQYSLGGTPMGEGIGWRQQTYVHQVCVRLGKTKRSLSWDKDHLQQQWKGGFSHGTLLPPSGEQDELLGSMQTHNRHQQSSVVRTCPQIKMIEYSYLKWAHRYICKLTGKWVKLTK